MLGSLLLCVAVLYASSAAGQPVSCKDDVQCSEGYFCEADAHICRECLRCQDLKRNPPLHPSVDMCVKSVADCGDCYEGLEVDRRRGDVSAECVAAPPTAGASPEPPGASSTWLYVIVALVLAALVVVFIIVLLLRRDIFKPAGSGRNSVMATITATAPEAPPPYNAVPGDSPGPYYTGNGHAANGNGNGHTGPYQEDHHPFIVKPAPRGGGSREAAGSQAARVYEKPFYLRENQPPSPVSSPVSETDNTAFFVDEETTESVWTPHDAAANGDVNASASPEAPMAGEGAAGALSLQLAAARHTDLVDPSPAKKMRVQQDTNNNRNRETNSGGDSTEICPRSPSPPPGHAGHGAHAGHAAYGAHAGHVTQIFNVVQYNK